MRATELLARVGATEAVGQIFHTVQASDVPLRWALLHVLSETGDPKAGRLFARVAMEPIRAERNPRACESPYDGEVLVRTMAIEGLARLALRDRSHVELLHEVIGAQPDRALRIEAVKAILAAAPDEARRLGETLPAELRFSLTLKTVRAQSLGVEHQGTGVDTVRPGPRLDRAETRPLTNTCCCG